VSIDVSAGKHVSKGQILARLKSPELEFEQGDLDRQAEEQRTLLDRLQQEREKDPTVVTKLVAAKLAVEETRTLLENLRNRNYRLDLPAPLDGTVFPPIGGTIPSLRQLMKPGEQFCIIGDPEECEAVMVIPEGQAEKIRTGQKVIFKLDAYPGETVETEVIDISRIASTGEYEVRAPLPNPEGLLMVGLRGHGTVYMESRPLWQRVRGFLW
jgi:multidrug efflux pump subunit AcrA (membrane-fusion protein)